LKSEDSRYDDVVSEVFHRLAQACRRGSIPADLIQQEARLNTWVRDGRATVQRKNKRILFWAEIAELLPELPHIWVSILADDIVEVIHQKATPRQRVVFDMLSKGIEQQEIAERIGLSDSLVTKEKNRLRDLLTSELKLRLVKRGTQRPSTDGVGLGIATPKAEPRPPETPVMRRIQSPLGAEVLAAIKAGANVTPTGGGFAGPVMTVKIPRSQLAEAPVDGIVPLPTPIILQSNSAGEQEMVASFVREISDGSVESRTFALYAFCKDKGADTPFDLSNFSFKSEVTDPKIIEIVTRSDLRQPEVISQRLWDYLRK
jgi:DNA-binding CsgD family transcriptional regulator